MVTASELITLKAKVKTEMLRRGHTGSVAAYGGAAYDFTKTPAKGGAILAEHGNKIIQPLNAVKATGLPNAVAGQAIPAGFDNAELTKIVNDMAAIPATAANGGCAASCTGLCQDGCTTGCSGCSGDCSGYCSGCSGCGDSCSSSCSGCSGTCSGLCGSGCGTSCSQNCTGTCRLVCEGTCQGGCNTDCNDGCTTACAGLCSVSCYLTCRGGAK